MPLNLRVSALVLKTLSFPYSNVQKAEMVIVRCYETTGKHTDAEIEVPFLNRRWKQALGCEIKTFTFRKTKMIK